MAKADVSPRRTRIQREKRQAIFEAALDVFSEKGLRGATLDQIANAAGLSKQNIVYYFNGKEAIYSELLESLLEEWVSPLRDLSADGEPLDEILTYVSRKMEMSRKMPRESRLFATEILHGAPRLGEMLTDDLKTLVDEKAAVIANWMVEGRLATIDPHHLIFSIWAMTQHYADFDLQVQAVLGPVRSDTRFEDAEAFIKHMLVRALLP
ncbi:TetR family transcriptional regulator C-terminal domain-containing protein [Aliiroseovarius sp. S2029]|uniref:TetR family transcriptional regulator C-terminal domain-containing protein n=1 Tax=Aliiroseovarius sp. S2029 TaxID=2936988 RepID=UPI0020C13D12|nr:TetR family transcriptional regulator C-terminal domain-containing protein [Aliiroseovarius sp. S2029]MCK8482771.1 TetR family transcriptional regulator C-terminal domain-containing protein [Aliiroseovarius sp. S2029]